MYSGGHINSTKLKYKFKKTASYLAKILFREINHLSKKNTKSLKKLRKRNIFQQKLYLLKNGGSTK